MSFPPTAPQGPSPSPLVPPAFSHSEPRLSDHFAGHRFKLDSRTGRILTYSGVLYTHTHTHPEEGDQKTPPLNLLVDLFFFLLNSFILRGTEENRVKTSSCPMPLPLPGSNPWTGFLSRSINIL